VTDFTARRSEVPQKKSWFARNEKLLITGVAAVVAAAVSAGIALLKHSEGQRAAIEQHTEGPNSPAITGNSNQVTYAAEPDVRSLPLNFQASLSRFAGQRFWVMAQTNDYDETSEQVRFSKVLDSALQSARWQKAPEVSPQPGRLYVRVSDRGVIVYAAGSSMEAGSALRDELRKGLNKVELAHDVNLKQGLVVMVGLQ
jgi:hypothetical protein